MRYVGGIDRYEFVICGSRFGIIALTSTITRIKVGSGMIIEAVVNAYNFRSACTLIYVCEILKIL